MISGSNRNFDKIATFDIWVFDTQVLCDLRLALRKFSKKYLAVQTSTYTITKTPLIMFGSSTGITGASIARTFVRGKKKQAMTLSTQKVANQLSALSANKKQPKLLKLCNEDLIKHRTISNAWKLYQQKVQSKRSSQLQKQYESIKTVMEDLKETSPQLFEYANEKEEGKRFPLEMRVPTDFPANQAWVYNYEPKTK